MLSTAVIIALFLLYFFYITRFDYSMIVSKPTTPYIDHRSPFTQRLTSHKSKFQYFVNGKVEWEGELPENYIVHNEKISLIDVCHGLPDGIEVLAKGKTLYDYMQKNGLVQKPVSFESNSNHIVQDKRSFFFTCLDSKIHDLHMCPPGRFFNDSYCQKIDRCTGREDGKRFGDPYDSRIYYECRGEKEIQYQCPPDGIFVHDECVNTTDPSLYCQFHHEPKILSPTVSQVCRDGRIAYETCPSGQKYIDKPTCEPDACLGMPNGARIPLPNVHSGPFVFSPGYRTCLSDRIVGEVICPSDWDSQTSKGEDLTRLPMVFDGKKCVVPEFCTNVESSDPDVIVPVHEFTKRVQNWKYSEVMDRIVGFTCPRKRVELDYGTRIGEDFKVESACDDTTSFYPIPGKTDSYYNCSSQKVESCPAGYIFDSKSCRPRIDDAFVYNEMDFFKFDDLTPDNWMRPFDQGQNTAEPCQSPESVSMKIYNLCSHPDCTHYTFLSMIPSFQIYLRDGSKCVYRDRRLTKESTSKKYLYWNQREDIDDSSDTCVPGNRLQTGNFVWDSTIYMTCDETQPFVFCPSSSTQGIEFVKGKRYACIPDMTVGFIRPQTKHTFEKNEVETIKNVGNVPTVVKIDNRDTVIPPGGVSIGKNRFTLETLFHAVRVKPLYRVTHPPEVVLGKRKKVMPEGNGFLMKLKKFTQSALDFPEYNVTQNAYDFVFE